MDFKKLTDYMDSLVLSGIPACDCVIYQKHKPVYRHMNGFSDSKKTKPVSGNDTYWLFSATKLFTCTAIMQLAEKGKLDIDEPVSKYLPAFIQMTVRDGDNIIPAKNFIKIRNLLTMTAGLNYDCNMPSILEVKKRTNNKATTQEIVNAIAKEPLSFEPSTHYQYSLCHDVLAAVIEVVCGQTFGEYLQQNIFAPLGITKATFRQTNETLLNMSAVYMYDDEKMTSTNIPVDNGYMLSENYESGGAGLQCTVDDYIKFADALANNGQNIDGTRIISKSSIDKMRHNELNDICYEDFKTLGKIGYSYGLGVRTLIDKAQSKGPVGEFGWDGAAGSYVMIDPINNIAIFYAQHVHNCGYAYGVIHPTIRDLTYEILEINT